MEDRLQWYTGIALRRGGNSEVYPGADGQEIRLDKRKISHKQVSHVSMMPAGLAHTHTWRASRPFPCLPYGMQMKFLHLKRSGSGHWKPPLAFLNPLQRSQLRNP